MLSQITFTINGPNVSPETVRVRDLLDMPGKFEAALVSTAKSAGASEPSLHLSLVQIASGSDVMVLSADREMTEAARVVSMAVNQRDETLVPQHAALKLIELHKRASRHGWSIGIANGDFSSDIDPRQPVFQDQAFKGTTAIYARITHIGGKKPTAKIEFDNGKQLTVDVASVDLAQEIGRYLYRFVTLEGEASWSTRTLELRRFRVQKLGQYDDSKGDPLTAFRELRELYGEVWDGVDPDECIRDLHNLSSHLGDLIPVARLPDPDDETPLFKIEGK